MKSNREIFGYGSNSVTINLIQKKKFSELGLGHNLKVNRPTKMILAPEKNITKIISSIYNTFLLTNESIVYGIGYGAVF
jgi:hypothetical protein